MLDPLSASAIFLGIAALSAVQVAINLISVVVLTLSKLSDLFSGWKQRNRVTRDDISFITRDLFSGEYSHVQGVFNKSTNEVHDIWGIDASEEEIELKRKLNQNPVTEIHA